MKNERKYENTCKSLWYMFYVVLKENEKWKGKFMKIWPISLIFGGLCKARWLETKVSTPYQGAATQTNIGEAKIRGERNENDKSK